MVDIVLDAYHRLCQSININDHSTKLEAAGQQEIKLRSP